MSKGLILERAAGANSCIDVPIRPEGEFAFPHQIRVSRRRSELPGLFHQRARKNFDRLAGSTTAWQGMTRHAQGCDPAPLAQTFILDIGRPPRGRAPNLASGSAPT